MRSKYHGRPGPEPKSGNGSSKPKPMANGQPGFFPPTKNRTPSARRTAHRDPTPSYCEPSAARGLKARRRLPVLAKRNRIAANRTDWELDVECWKFQNIQ